MILVFATSAVALDTETPIGFFTNFGSRLLKSELKLDLNRIQVYPTNQYTPAVHRLLQVTANLYDSTTNRSETDYPFLPSVFRPLFRRDDHGMVWISAYREVTSADLAAATAEPIDLEDSGSLGDIPAWGTPFDPNDANEPMVCGVPLIIGVKKGYPNFNKFGLENTITASRILSFHRTAVGQRVSQTNQSYGLSISSSYGIQAWNSYQAPFPRSLELIATGKVKLVLANEFGIVINESFASPWLNTNELYSQFAISDAALEKIPGQLLSLLRSDSVGTITPHQNELLVQFTGYDCSAYAIAVSPNLTDWTFISTNHPSEGVLAFTNTTSADALFFRTVLCP